jgi:hypothetical protein
MEAVEAENLSTKEFAVEDDGSSMKEPEGSDSRRETNQ